MKFPLSFLTLLTSILFLPATVHAALPKAPAILKWQSTIPGWKNGFYWYETDGNRYSFTTEASYQSWFPGTPTGVFNTDIPDLSNLALAGSVFHKPGSRLVTFDSSPRVYAVSRFGVLRWLTTEQVALELYGEAWKDFIDTLPVTHYGQYRFGSPITDSAEYDIGAYHALTNPSSNAVNANTRPPEAFEAKVTLVADKTDVKTGEELALTASVSNAHIPWNKITIRFYDRQEALIHTCEGTASCSVTVVAGGPLGSQFFTARAFNEFEQAVTSNPVPIYVSNP